VFLSYASQDEEAAHKICETLRAAGIEVWFDKSELRGGDAWDQKIRRQIRECSLFLPIISAHSQARLEGYFRREWKLAVDRTHDMAEEKAFIVPVVIDDTSEQVATVPDKFRDVQWTRLRAGEPSPVFIDRVRKLLSPGSSPAGAAQTPVSISSATLLSSKTSGPQSWRSKPALWAMGAMLAVALSYFMVDKFWVSKRPASSAASTLVAGVPTKSAVPEKSIAVLPFVDMSEKKDQEYFADGMAEEIIDLLARVPDLRVPARTSSFYFKGKTTKVSEIARELRVAHVLEGSVRRAGGHLRVTAQLVRADSGYNVWSKAYDRDVHDVFKVQDDIANAVVQALQISLMGGLLTRQSGGTESLDAYLAYLRGVAAQRQGTRESLAAGRDDLEHAIKLDPEFGLAWVELARDIGLMTDNGEFSAKEGYERTRQLAQRALELSPNLAEAHALLAYVHRAYDWDWTAAEAEGKRALALDPTDSSSLAASAGLAMTLGRWDDAEGLIRRALDRDPFFPLAIWYSGAIQYGAGHYAGSEAAYRKLLEVAPSFLWTRAYLGKTLLAEGKADTALAMVQQEADEENRLKMLPIVLHAAGRASESDAALRALIAKFAQTDAYSVAMSYAYRGDRDLAFQWLDRAYLQRDSSLVEIVGDPLFKNLFGDPRHKTFLRKMNLPE
jgi:TolB-like protein/Tfp pilus assembly protein PilF